MQDANAVRNVVTAHFANQQFDEGEKILNEQAADLPEAVRLECVGNLHFYRKQLQAAIVCYESAIKILPDYEIARYHYLVGAQEEREGNLVEAFKRYQSAIGIEPTFVDVYVELGGLLVKVGDLEGALRCYRDAVRIDPLDLGNYHNLKAVLTRLVEVDPERYSADLAAAEAAYEATSRGRQDISQYRS